jgi:type II secretory pathway pseudopilin PulG
LRRSNESGFTLIELLAGMLLMFVMLGIGVFALRQFWQTRSLRGAQDVVTSQLRQLQERSVSESHPLVYGARFRVGSPTFGIVKFNPNSASTTTDDTCVEMTKVTLESNVQVTAASFTSASGITSLCRTQISGAGSDEFAFFYARGTATSGSITLVSPALAGRSRTVTVTPITGRVDGS